MTPTVEVELDEDLDDGEEGVGVGVGVAVLVSEGVSVGVGLEVGASVGGLELVGVGVGVGVLISVLLLLLLLEAELLEPELEESPLGTSKVTMLALEPGGTVTTQPVAPPAPVKTFKASITFTAMLEGSIEQGTPLQPGPSHSILIPKLGRTLRNGVVACR